MGAACAAEPIDTTDLSNAMSRLGQNLMRVQQANLEAAAAAADARLAEARALTASGVAESASTASTQLYNNARSLF